MKMTAEMFDNIINTSQDCVFWKDKDRRFVGVNKAFLDFYGFESADVLIGKNDEEMGWHTDPESYMEDEIRVLQGHSTYKVPGKCIIKGEERDIIASKRPIYDGDEIVGLVGSFVDVTDIIGENRLAGNAQVLYTREKLCKYPYFDKLLHEIPIDQILDPLTGVISRRYFLNFVKAQIKEGVPFTFGIVDLDNFKQINDSYGHNAGDIVLVNVSKKMAEYFENFGLVGRFGGDELLLINFRDLEYDDKKKLFEEMYYTKHIFNQKIGFENSEIILTSTVGCATYPTDASDYDSLFGLIDKTLYRGKSKGRNCYIIYVESKHKDLEIKNLAKQSLYTNMNGLLTRLENASGFEDRLLSVSRILKTELNVAEVLYVNKALRLRSPSDKSLDVDVSDIEEIMDGELTLCKDFTDYIDKAPKLINALSARKLYAAVIVRIGLNKETDGYLIGAADRKQIWQNDAGGIVYFIAKSLAAYCRLNGEEIPE